MARSAEDWRRRLTGRSAFDRDAAEAAVRQAYRECALPAPDSILWARGPRETAEALRFLLRPPGRHRILAWALMATGAALWTSLAVVTGPMDESPVGITLVAGVLGFYLVRQGARELPRPVFAPSGPRSGFAVLGGTVVFLLMMLALLAVRHFGLYAGTPILAGELALVAAAGSLPGALLLRRVSRAYRDVPDSIRHVTPGRSVARILGRARRRALSRRRGPRIAVHPEDDLVRAYQSAYSEAFLTRPGPFLGPGAAELDSQVGQIEPPVWATARATLPTGPFLIGLTAHLDGIRDAELVSIENDEGNATARAFADLAFHVDRVYPFRRIALAVEPPTSVSVDADGRPHAGDGPALAWADGTRVHAWRGRTVDPDLVDASIPLNVRRIRAERDPDRQAVLIERYGLGRYMTESAASEIQADACGSLFRLEQRVEPIVAVRVVNGTAEPDGSFREFWLRVPPGVRTAREAVAWTFGMTADEYAPLAQS